RLHGHGGSAAAFLCRLPRPRVWLQLELCGECHRDALDRRHIELGLADRGRGCGRGPAAGRQWYPLIGGARCGPRSVSGAVRDPGATGYCRCGSELAAEAAVSALLQVSRLGKRFGGFVALEAIDLEVEEGERLGLIGPNGSGKSTLVNCICGTLHNETGS